MYQKQRQESGARKIKVKVKTEGERKKDGDSSDGDDENDDDSDDDNNDEKEIEKKEKKEGEQNRRQIRLKGFKNDIYEVLYFVVSAEEQNARIRIIVNLCHNNIKNNQEKMANVRELSIYPRCPSDIRADI